jgi:nicotinic acid phosphoribosyltransferase
VEEVRKVQKELGWGGTNEGELAAFCAYAVAFPKMFLALVDTYETLSVSHSDLSIQFYMEAAPPTIALLWFRAESRTSSLSPLL